nr:unnamed protein product [Callosobruchus analis]
MRSKSARATMSGFRPADQQRLTDLKRKYNGSIALNGKKVADLKKLMKYISSISHHFFIDIIADSATKAATGDEQLSSDNVEGIDGDEEINNME